MVEAQLHWMADAHLCVSREMGEWLRRHFRLRAVTVLYDRPPAAVFNRLFLPPSAGQDEEQAQTLLVHKHELLLRLGLTDSQLFPQLMSRQRLMQGSRLPSRTVLTQEAHSGGRVSRRADRASFLVSSTSWTPDEDFSILERCIRNIDAVLVSQELLQDSDGSSELPLPPRLVVVVTGKGPRRDAFLASLGIDTRTEKNASAEDTLTIGEPLKRVAVKALWLQPEDYPLLLSCADVGVCLHTSTSGLDLPMKVDLSNRFYSNTITLQAFYTAGAGHVRRWCARLCRAVRTRASRAGAGQCEWLSVQGQRRAYPNSHGTAVSEFDQCADQTEADLPNRRSNRRPIDSASVGCPLKILLVGGQLDGVHAACGAATVGRRHVQVTYEHSSFFFGEGGRNSRSSCFGRKLPVYNVLIVTITPL